jgi:hypothetical protein
MSAWKDLFGTLLTKFQIGLTGNTLKSGTGGRLEIRDTNDSAFSPLAANRVDVAGNDIIIGSEGANTLTLRRNGTQSSAVTWTFPATAGTAGQALGTDGSGNITFIAIAGGSDKVSSDVTTLAFGDTSPKSMFTLPANAVINAVRVNIDTAFNGSPTMSVGTSGATSKYVATTQVDLKRAAGTVFEIYPGLTPVGTSEALQIAYSAGGATVGAARVEVFYDIPS